MASTIMTFYNIANIFRHTKVDPRVPDAAENVGPPKRYFPEIRLPEKTDPRVLVRYIFSPNEIPTRLIVEKNMFSRTSEAYPIMTARSGAPFHNLQVRERLFKSDEMVVEDATTGKPTIVLVRYIKQSGYRFHIYLTHPVYDCQEPINLMNVKRNERLYPFARAERASSKTILVTLEESQSNPTYTIHKALMVAYPTKFIIQQNNKAVATTQEWNENSNMLEVKPGTDASLMLCLAAIADDEMN